MAKQADETEVAIWERDDRALPLIGLAVHAGHGFRDDLGELMDLDENERRYEEDPGTEVFARLAPVRGIGRRSRFEVDLNRPRDEAVYREDGDDWEVAVWRRKPPDPLLQRSLELYDDFYARLGREIGSLLERHERVAVLDFHSYNHRRGGPDRDPDPADETPDVNVGTGSLDRARWGSLVDNFMAQLSAAGSLDVRENVRFKGRAVAAFVNGTFPERAFCLALEFKKTYMDEHTGEIYPDRLGALAAAVSDVIPTLMTGQKTTAG